MTSEVRRRPGGRSARVREAVLRAALEVISESGPSGFRIAEIAARADVHESSIYRRWGTRDRLTIDALLSHSEDTLKVPDTGSIHGDLVELGQALVRYGTSPLGAAISRTMASSIDDEASAQMRTEFWEARHTAVMVLVDRAKRRGELSDVVDGRRLIEVFISPIHFRLLLTRESIDDQYLDNLALIAIHGTSGSAASKGPSSARG